jgi:hypothetical protein
VTIRGAELGEKIHPHLSDRDADRALRDIDVCRTGALACLVASAASDDPV